MADHEKGGTFVGVVGCAQLASEIAYQPLVSSVNRLLTNIDKSGTASGKAHIDWGRRTNPPASSRRGGPLHMPAIPRWSISSAIPARRALL
jgi:hypothetical protein